MEDFENDSSSSIENEKMTEKNNIENDNQKEEEEEEKFIIQSTPSFIEKSLIESVSKMENVTKEKLDLAEKINFKNNTDKLVETDEFGFL